MADPFDYIESRADADELIAEFGGAAFLVRDVVSGPAWDPTVTPVAFATQAVRVEFTWRQLQGGDVLATDQRWLVAAGPLDAQGVRNMAPPDRIQVNGVEVTVVKADPLQPAGTVVMFDCQCRV